MNGGGAIFGNGYRYREGGDVCLMKTLALKHI
jgi:hypothetical protein